MLHEKIILIKLECFLFNFYKNNSYNYNKMYGKHTGLDPMILNNYLRILLMLENEIITKNNQIFDQKFNNEFIENNYNFENKTYSKNTTKNLIKYLLEDSCEKEEIINHAMSISENLKKYVIGHHYGIMTSNGITQITKSVKLFIEEHEIPSIINEDGIKQYGIIYPKLNSNVLNVKQLNEISMIKRNNLINTAKKVLIKSLDMKRVLIGNNVVTEWLKFAAANNIPITNQDLIILTKLFNPIKVQEINNIY